MNAYIYFLFINLPRIEYKFRERNTIIIITERHTCLGSSTAAPVITERLWSFWLVRIYRFWKFRFTSSAKLIFHIAGRCFKCEGIALLVWHDHPHSGTLNTHSFSCAELRIRTRRGLWDEFTQALERKCRGTL